MRRMKRQMKRKKRMVAELAAGLGAVWITGAVADTVQALPPPEDIPEEVLRTEVITEARSPINGEPMTAQAYAELEAQREAESVPVLRSTLDPELRDLIFLLQIRRTLRTFIPLIP